jgi:hypothetical protein
MGKHFAWTGALILESLTKLINLAGSLTPGNVGIYEGGTMVIAGFFGLSGTVGMTLGLCRRLRGIFWALCGIPSFFLASRTVGHRDEIGSSGSSRQKTQSPPDESRIHARTSTRGNAGGVKLGVNPRHSMKQALQGVKILAQEPALCLFRLFAALQYIQNRLINDRHEQTFGSSRLNVA